MVGLSKPGYWLSCMINFSAPALLALLIITLMLTLDIDGDGAVLMYSSAFVVLIFLICYLFAAAWFILFIATMFRTSEKNYYCYAVEFFWILILKKLYKKVGWRTRSE